jgi:hypothetical protein
MLKNKGRQSANWVQRDTGNRAVMLIDSECHVADAPDSEERKFWQSLGWELSAILAWRQQPNALIEDDLLAKDRLLTKNASVSGYARMRHWLWFPGAMPTWTTRRY